MRLKPKKDEPELKRELESYFKIGISDEYILIRDDFPIESVSPGDFKKLLVGMFKKNDEVRRNVK